MIIVTRTSSAVKLAVFAGVPEFPVRVKCATWLGMRYGPR